MVSSKDAVARDLGPYLDTLGACVRGALEDFMENYSKQRRLMTKRSEASLIHDLMVRRCDRAFGDVRDNGGTHGVLKSGNSRLVLFKDGRIRVKPKKMDKKHRTRNIDTQAVLRFVFQVPQMSFAQIPAPTNLHVGYVVDDDAAITSAAVWITCPSGHDVGWELELKPTTKASPIPAIVHAATGTEAKSRRARVKPEVAAKRVTKPRKAEDGTDRQR
jgi:hypothetical protein